MRSQCGVYIYIYESMASLKLLVTRQSSQVVQGLSGTAAKSGGLGSPKGRRKIARCFRFQVDMVKKSLVAWEEETGATQ